jgi:hypothetical protein
MGTPGVEAGTVCVVTATIFGDLADLLDDIDEDEFAAIVNALTAAGVGTTDVEVFFDISEALCDAIGTAPGVFSWWVTVGDDIPDVDAEYGAVAGVYKQVTGDSPVTNARTTSADDIVDGYTGLNGNQITTATNEYVVPIVQTNNRWNTQIRLTNFSDAGTTPYSITIYEAGGSGALGPSVGQFTGSFAGGDTVTYNLLDEGFPEEFVGTAFIETNAPVGAVAERVKDFTDMLIMTTSRPVFQDAGDHVAPLVFQDWNFWNTGIATANTGDTAATVTYNYHPPLSGFTQDQRNIAPRAMEYVYRPGGQELGIGTVGAAILRSQQPHASTVDEVKYFGDLPDVGHAMSYATVPWDDLATDGEGLALPLFQRGNPLDDTGDTSGIQLFNASADNSVTFEMTIYNTAGNPVAPTLLQPISETLAPRANYTIYSHDLAELPVGFQGSVIIRVSGGGALGAVSNNVNYAVQFDGSAAYNLVNIPALPEVPEIPVVLLDLEPDTATNPFYDDDSIAFATAQALLAVDTQFYAGATLDDVFDDITDDDNLISEEDFVAFLDGAAITQAEADALIDAWFSVNQHVVTATVYIDGEVADDDDFEIAFTVQGAHNFEETIDTDDGVAVLSYNAVQSGTDFINASIVDLDIDAAQVTKIWEPATVDLDVDALTIAPIDGVNDFYDDIFLGRALAIEALDFVDADADGIYNFITDPTGVDGDLDAYIDALVADGFTEDEIDLIVEAWLGVNVHIVTTTFVNQFGLPINIAGLVDTDFAVVVTDDDDFAIAIDSIVVDPDTGVATISYTAVAAGVDTIAVTATVDGVDYLVETTKTWEDVDDDNGNGNG